MSLLSPTTLDYIKALKIAINEKQAELAHRNAKGGATDFAAYKFSAGQYVGLEEALKIIEEVHDQWNR